MIGTAIAGLVISVASAYESNRQNQAAYREQKKGAEINQAQQNVKAAAERRAQIRQERVRRAQILQASFDTGTAGSSGELGGISSLDSQIGNNMSNINEGATTSNNLFSISQAYAAHKSAAETYGVISSLSSSIGSFALSNTTPKGTPSDSKNTNKTDIFSP